MAEENIFPFAICCTAEISAEVSRQMNYYESPTPNFVPTTTPLASVKTDSSKPT